MAGENPDARLSTAGGAFKNFSKGSHGARYRAYDKSALRPEGVKCLQILSHG